MRGWLARLVVSAWGSEGRRREEYGVWGTAIAGAGAGAGLLAGVQMRLDCVGLHSEDPAARLHAATPHHAMPCGAVQLTVCA
jgi:hypothetical protein